MKKIQVLGPGCPKCAQLYRTVTEAVDQLGLECELTKVTEINDIVALGVMMTPGLVIDGQVVLQGKAPGIDEVKALIAE